MVKIISLSKTREKNESSYLANFSVSGELVPLRVSETDRPSIYAEVQNLIKNSSTYDELELGLKLFYLMSPEENIKRQINESVELSGNVKITNGHIYFGDNLLEETLETHMLSLLDDDNTPKDETVWKSYVRFLDNLHQNVSEDIRKQLFRWMEYENKAGNAFGITNDGCIVGYKGCAGTILEPTSVHEGFAIVDGVEMNGKIPNKVGSVITMPRSDVEFNPNVGCSTGLHVGTRDYAVQWAPILTLVKVNPRDVVSVPYECENQKMRVCEYTVLEVTNKEEEHKRLVKVPETDTELTFTRIPQEDYELSLEECYDLLYEEITVEYEDYEKEFTGTIVDVFESWNGTDDGVILKDEDDNYKHIKLYRINDWALTEDNDDNDENEDEDSHLFSGTLADDIARELDEFLKSIQKEFDNDGDDNELSDKINSVEEGDYIKVSYDDFEKDFEGQVSSIYGNHDGLIIRSIFDDVKHIKTHRICEIDIEKEDTRDEDNQDNEDNQGGLSQELKVGTQVVVHSLVSGKLVVKVGLVKFVMGGDLYLQANGELIRVNLHDIISITEI